jgi:excisionase family DNA binding protein
LNAGSPNEAGDSQRSPYLTAEETADLLRTTRQAVWALAERGRLPGARKFGRRLLVRRADLVRSIEASVLSPTKDGGK